MSTKTKSTKSSKSSTTAKAARKPSKQKTKNKPKTRKKTCGCTAPKIVLPPPIDDYQYDDIDYINELEKLDSPTYFYYVVNNENKEKYVVSGIELQFNDAKTPYGLAWTNAAGDTYRTTGIIHYETYETEENRCTVTLLPREPWAPFIA
jgi:hypothetical protein